jgi:hypothetical protein
LNLAGISVLTAILFGLAPALRLTSVDLAPALKESVRGVIESRWRFGGLLVGDNWRYPPCLKALR